MPQHIVAYRRTITRAPYHAGETGTTLQLAPFAFTDGYEGYQEEIRVELLDGATFLPETDMDGASIRCEGYGSLDLRTAIGLSFAAIIGS